MKVTRSFIALTLTVAMFAATTMPADANGEHFDKKLSLTLRTPDKSPNSKYDALSETLNDYSYEVSKLNEQFKNAERLFHQIESFEKSNKGAYSGKSSAQVTGLRQSYHDLHKNLNSRLDEIRRHIDQIKNQIQKSRETLDKMIPSIDDKLHQTLTSLKGDTGRLGKSKLAKEPKTYKHKTKSEKNKSS